MLLSPLWLGCGFEGHDFEYAHGRWQLSGSGEMAWHVRAGLQQHAHPPVPAKQFNAETPRMGWIVMSYEIRFSLILISGDPSVCQFQRPSDYRCRSPAHAPCPARARPDLGCRGFPRTKERAFPRNVTPYHMGHSPKQNNNPRAFCTSTAIEVLSGIPCKLLRPLIKIQLSLVPYGYFIINIKKRIPKEMTAPCQALIWPWSAALGARAVHRAAASDSSASELGSLFGSRFWALF